MCCRNKNSTTRSFTSLISGLTSGVAVQIIYQPIEFLRVRQSASGRGEVAKIGLSLFSTTRNILAEEGFLSFYVGLVPSILASGISWGIYISSYNASKQFFQRRNEKLGIDSFSWSQLLMSGVVSGLVTNVVSHPILLLRTRMQLENTQVESCCGNHGSAKGRYKTSYSGLRDMLKNGIGELYIGFSLSLIASLGHAVLHFVFYDKVKEFYLKKYRSGEKHSHLRFFESFLISGITKSFACGFFHPLSVMCVRLQDLRNKEFYAADGVRYRGVISGMSLIYRQEGFRSFYRGIVPHLTKAFPSGGLSLMLYELTLRAMNNIFSKDDNF